MFGCSICLAALLFYVLQALALDPFYLGGGGRPVSLLRYAMWSHTTPSMIYMIAQLSESEDERHLNHVLAANYAMLAVGVVGNVIQHPVRHAVCAVAIAFFAFLIRSLHTHLSRGVNATSSLFITHNDGACPTEQRVSAGRLLIALAYHQSRVAGHQACRRGAVGRGT